ncbi:MAG: cytochrome c554 family protein [Spirochaetes bacterium]|nr:cytochrome c554 family protein [Spirochaetota bacterium]
MEKIKLFLCYPALLFVITIVPLSCKRAQHFELSRFVSPETCAGCHGDIYDQWKGSMHSLSHGDPIYLKVALHDLKGLTDPDEIKEAELCVKCHTPVGFVSGLPVKTSDHGKEIPELAQKGVQCDFCHSATGAGKIYNADLRLDPGNGEEDPGTKRGPHRDSVSDYHKSDFSKFHTRSEICGVCHDVRHVVFGTKLETSYEEWEKSPYASQGIPCQGCHMYQRPGVPATGSTERPLNPGESASGGPERKHVHTHYFAGGNSLVPGLSGAAVNANLAEERLKNAAVVSIDESGAGGTIRITVKNTGAGHSIPTGLAHVRQVWLEVKVTGRGGKTLVHSGRIETNGALDPSSVIYHVVFGDGKGNPVYNVAKAREILKDRRIEAMKSLSESYQLPEGSKGPFTVEAKLWYRLAPQEIIDAVAGKGAFKLPSVLMASDRKIINP